MKKFASFSSPGPETAGNPRFPSPSPNGENGTGKNVVKLPPICQKYIHVENVENML
ncbi:hypothetical protein B4135_0840 [Caldibacillus debilis]|uniref:Uncharacterized protein n=1 Tax=Caldibacillus debilis TaxID=301148 RepID=A0A150M6F8_9BACI|nr:hypothetical protein B4135_0840 [Caldibacillus debilis]